MKKSRIIGFLVLLFLLYGIYFYYTNLRGAWFAFGPPDKDVTDPIVLSTILPPPGYAIEIFADGVPSARVMARDQFGNFWVSQTGEGTISHLIVEEGRVVGKTLVFRNLRKPHGLAFDPDDPAILYIAEQDKISRVRIYSDERMEKIIDLPPGEHHITRTIGFGPDKRLYVSIGSSCNVCIEEDQHLAKIFSMDKEGKDFKEFARGLRNTVFFTWDEWGRMWATEMGRDFLGDDLPPDEINSIEEGRNYGWPICYGKNIHDDQFDTNTYIRNPCMEPFEAGSVIDIPAHSAPLGLALVPNDPDFPSEWWGDLVVSYHGSWNKTEPTGYKIVRFDLDEDGRYLGTVSDFITGWLGPEGVIGRPVDLLFADDGLYTDSGLYISDDKGGVIYRMFKIQ